MPSKVCGSIASREGSENGDMHCLKQGQVTASASEGYYCHRDSQTKLERKMAIILLLAMLSKTWRV